MTNVHSPAIWVVLGCTLALQLLVLRRLRFDWGTTIIALAATVLYVDYLTYTALDERNYDGSSHAEYIRFIAAHARLPDLRTCRFCTHPPLYYVLGAVWSGAALRGGWLPAELGLQWFSLLLFSGFVVFALLLVRRATDDAATRWLAALLIVFWPSSVIHSVRVHVDALASPLMLAAIYWLGEWDWRGRARDLHAALGCAALALLTKASAYAVAATLIGFVFWRLRSGTEPWRRRIERCALVVLVLAAAAGVALFLRDTGQTFCQSLIGRACAGRYVPPEPDTLGRFLSFDLSSFLRRMDTVPSDPFLNRFFKSILFGVQPLGDDFEEARYRTIASLQSALLLVMILVCALGALQLRAASLRRYRVYLVAPVVLFVFLVGFRVLAPNEFHEDFRHIFPALVPFCLGYAGTVARFRRYSALLFRAGVAVGIAMAAASLLFFVR